MGAGFRANTRRRLPFIWPTRSTRMSILVLADQFHQATVREINSPAPLVSGVPKMRREVIFLSRIRIADDLELLRIVVNDDPSKCVGRRLMTKMAAHISDTKLTLRARLVQMVSTGRRHQR